MVKFIPERGDVIWLEFDPQRGKEIQKRRPALVISPLEYNARTRLVLCFPITSKIKNYPFEVILRKKQFAGAILSDQLRSFDWQARKAKFILKCDRGIVEAALLKFKLLLE